MPALLFADIAQMGEQFRGQDSTTGSSTDRIMREAGEFVVEQRVLAQAANCDSHAVADLAVKHRLGPVVFGIIGQERRRGRG